MKELKIEKLPEIVKRSNGEFCLIRRNEELAIYVRMKTGKYLKSPTYLEVFIIRKINGKKTAEHFNKKLGKEFYKIEEIPDIKEKYPRDEDFGKTAWCYTDFDSAEKRYESLVDYVKTKNEEKKL